MPFIVMSRFNISCQGIGNARSTMKQQHDNIYILGWCDQNDQPAKGNKPAYLPTTPPSPHPHHS